VILNTMCPGIVKTGLARHFKAKSAAFAIAIMLFHGILGKSAENGARTYMAAVTTRENEHVSAVFCFLASLIQAMPIWRGQMETG
jgi:hypothetical protein